jgi:hypothetical protein
MARVLFKFQVSIKDLTRISYHPLRVWLAATADGQTEAKKQN